MVGQSDKACNVGITLFYDPLSTGRTVIVAIVAPHLTHPSLLLAQAGIYISPKKREFPPQNTESRTRGYVNNSRNLPTSRTQRTQGRNIPVQGNPSLRHMLSVRAYVHVCVQALLHLNPTLICSEEPLHARPTFGPSQPGTAPTLLA